MSATHKLGLHDIVEESFRNLQFAPGGSDLGENHEGDMALFSSIPIFFSTLVVHYFLLRCAAASAKPSYKDFANSHHVLNRTIALGNYTKFTENL